MTAFWSAMVRNCIKQIQAKNTEKTDLFNYTNKLKDQISLMQDNQNSIWQQNEMAATAAFSSASQSIQQRIAQIQGDSNLDQATKNTQIQQLQSELQYKKSQADMEMQQMKRMWDQQQREQLKPLNDEQTRLQLKMEKITEDVEALKQQKEYYQAQKKESNQEFYGGGKA